MTASERAGDERLRHYAKHWPTEMRAVCAELLALRAERDRMRAVVEAIAPAARALVDLDDNGLLDTSCECGECIWCDDIAAIEKARPVLDALDREEREAAPASGDPELAAAVARLEANRDPVLVTRMSGETECCGCVGSCPSRTGTLRDVLIALARDVSEEGR